jgi:hypothetical protein
MKLPVLEGSLSRTGERSRAAVPDSVLLGDFFGVTLDWSPEGALDEICQGRFH